MQAPVGRDNFVEPEELLLELRVKVLSCLRPDIFVLLYEFEHFTNIFQCACLHFSVLLRRYQRTISVNDVELGLKHLLRGRAGVFMQRSADG